MTGRGDMEREKGEMISQGRTAEVFTWGENQVLKLFLKGFPAKDAEYEAMVTEAAHKVGLPVPAVQGTVKVDGRRGIIFERVDGPILTIAMVSKPWKFFKLTRFMAELHEMIHACEIPGLDSQREELETAIRERAPLQTDQREGLLKMLARLPDGNALCHGDFHPENILMTARGPIVIDWLTAKRGNPMADVARTSLILRIGTPPGVGAVLRRLMILGANMLNSVYLKRYAQFESFSREEINRWLPLLAAVRLVEAIPEEKRQLLAIVEAGLKA